MENIASGQRWVNDAELQLGLGTVLEVDGRTVTLSFQASGETRSYALQSAPLTRIIFSTGDLVKTRDGLEITVTRVDVSADLISYIGNDKDGREHELSEVSLDDHLQLNRPVERLQSGQIDKDRWFALRYRSLVEVNRLNHSPLHGLLGCRVSLIPHQLYIAHEVANRYAPRVLLADEVGLGKTIEAGLILHQQVITERARRIIVVVPENLVHQWLVEMLRRFNMHFSIFDEDRYQSILEGDSHRNPFDNDQLVLCSIEFLAENSEALQHASLAEWDLLVVDEAHHLNWSPDGASSSYKAVELLSSNCPGVLLLTATPEQLGKSGHFARLRLLDEERFPDYARFIEEENYYQPVAEAIETLFSCEVPGITVRKQLLDSVNEESFQGLDEFIESSLGELGETIELKTRLIEHFIDHHGTGRVLFRNTRASVDGFPQRKLSATALPLPALYEELEPAKDEVQHLLTPEILLAKQDGVKWTKADPRVLWLEQKLEEIRPERCLVICASRETALDLAQHFRVSSGLHLAVFHEDMSILERDRAAAYFADDDEVCQALICSEIGSEGRNFQFAHHLVLFDLPLNPDLLEQRIGRLDRIGQKETVQIHLAYFENSAQHLHYQWLHDGLGAFEKPGPAASMIFQEMQARLLQAFENPLDEKSAQMIEDTQTRLGELEEKMEKGRDRLLEYNSCRPSVAAELCESARKEDSVSSIKDYMELSFDCFGVDSVEHSRGRYILHPAENMLMNFPQLQEEGMTVCYDRETALSHEDVHFLSWEHPMVIGAMDMVLSSELGNTAMISISHEKLEPGKLFIECIYILDAISMRDLKINRYLPPSCIRVVLDEAGKDWSEVLKHETLNHLSEEIDRDTAIQVAKLKTPELKELLDKSEKRAKIIGPEFLEKAHAKASSLLNTEITRLTKLAKVNPNVRQDEIEYLQDQLHRLELAIDASDVRLDALRIIITT